jgi:CRP/FNR family transcriptional regulator, cyclic AMP receptor protein
MSEPAAAALLATVPLFADRGEADLAELAGMLHGRTLREGAVLWRQGDEARELVFVVDGALSASLRVAGGRLVEIGRAGPGDMVGELALLDGGPRTMAVRAAADSTVLALSRQGLMGLLGRNHPWAFSLKRRLMILSAERLRGQLARLAGPPGDGEPVAALPDAELEYRPPPDSRYVRRMATFHDFDPLAVWGFLTSGRYAECAAGRTLLVEGTPPEACHLTINGAVEKVIVRGGRRIRVGLAGPGRLVGYEGLIEDRPSPITAITRERCLLLVLPRDPFKRLFTAEDAIGRVFLDVIQRDIMATLRQTLPPVGRLPGLQPVLA